ncbi:MFS transporter (plasmid) [Halorussus salilacus]|uniref:MFS transporter n=1 Tax=Halorussus salilacus TaxID=2953750 RepID=UPI0020A1E723|nr:MFS transporter [Halorussus salilacus]USZ69812.1 MFS transporter [Halorussus salilacus]
MSAPRAGSATAAAELRRPRRALVTVLAVVFLDLLGFGIIIPILPFYVRSFGVSDVYIGLLAASYSAMQFLFAPLLGSLSDRRGRRPVILVSVAGSALAWTVFGLAGSVAVLFVSRMLAGAMGGNLAAAQAYVSDVTPPERRAGAFGLVGAAFGLGFIFGPALGGAFASDAAVTFARGTLPGFVPVTRFSLPSFAAALLSLLNFGFAALFLEESGARATAVARARWLSSFRSALSDDSLRGLVVAFFLLSVAFSGVQVMFVPFAADRYGYGATGTALLLTYIGVLGVAFQGVLVGRLSRRYPDASLAVAGAALLALALAALPFAPDIGRALVPRFGGPAFLTREAVALVAVLPGLSLGNALLSVSLTTLVSKSAGADVQGSAFGITQGVGSLGRTVGPPVMASLYVVAFWTPFAVGAVLLVGTLVVVAGLRGVAPAVVGVER